MIASFCFIQPTGSAQTPANNPTQNIPISGQAGGNGTNFTGTLSLTEFMAIGNELGVFATLSGNVSNQLGSNILQVANLELALDVTNLVADCSAITFTIPASTATLDTNLDLALPSQTIEITAEGRKKNPLQNLMCKVSRFSERGPRKQKLVEKTLNLILEVLDRRPHGEDDEE